MLTLGHQVGPVGWRNSSRAATLLAVRLPQYSARPRPRARRSGRYAALACLAFTHSIPPALPPCWYVACTVYSPGKQRALQRAIGEAVHARTLVALLVHPKEQPTTTPSACKPPAKRERHQAEPDLSSADPSAALTKASSPPRTRRRNDSSGALSGGGGGEENDDLSRCEAEARVYGRLWAYVNPRMRARDVETERAYRPRSRLSRFMPVHLELLESLYVEDLARETGPSRPLEVIFFFKGRISRDMTDHTCRHYLLE